MKKTLAWIILLFAKLITMNMNQLRRNLVLLGCKSGMALTWRW